MITSIANFYMTQCQRIVKVIKVCGNLSTAFSVLSQILFSIYPNPNPFPTSAFSVIFRLFKQKTPTCYLPVALCDTNPFNSTQK